MASCGARACAGAVGTGRAEAELDGGEAIAEASESGEGLISTLPARIATTSACHRGPLSLAAARRALGGAASWDWRTGLGRASRSACCCVAEAGFVAAAEL